VRDHGSRSHTRPRRPRPAGRRHPQARHHPRCRRCQRHPPRPRAYRRPTHRLAIDHARLHQRWLFPHLGDPTRPPRALDQVHETVLDNLDRLCPRCHRRKTHDGWALVPGQGRRPLVPPDDPRHPNDSPPHADDADRGPEQDQAIPIEPRAGPRRRTLCSTPTPPDRWLHRDSPTSRETSRYSPGR
jgi:hypothetical protein